MPDSLAVDPWSLPGRLSAAIWNWAARSIISRKWRRFWLRRIVPWACACTTTPNTAPILSSLRLTAEERSSICWGGGSWNEKTSDYLLNEPVTIAGVDRRAIGLKHYCFDPSLAPAGKSALEVMLESSYGYWQRIYGHKLYDTEQDQVAQIVIELLERWYPGLAQQIEVVDVATPLSYERYTGNWLGSTCGWLLTKQTMRMNILGISKTLPGLRNFYMIGQWVEPGGTLSLAGTSGRHVT